MIMRKKYITTDREVEHIEQRLGLLSDNMEARTDHEQAKRFNLIFGVTTGLGTLLSVLVITWASYYRGGFSWTSNLKLQFNWHPVLMIISLVFLYSQSILIYRSKRNVLKRKLKLLHTFMNILAFVLAVIGLQAVFDTHNLNNPPTPNLYTLHSWVGILTVILFAYQLVGGFLAFLYPGFSSDIRAKIMPIHRAIGTATFMMAIIAATSGFLEKAIWTLDKSYRDLPAEGWLINMMGIILITLGLLVLYLVNEPSYKRVPLVEDEMVLTENLDEGSSVITKDN